MTDQPEPIAPAIVDRGMEEAAQALLSGDVVPMGRVEELLAAIQGPAVRAVLEARIEQIVRHGHDRDFDADLPPGKLPALAQQFAGLAKENIDAIPERRDFNVARRRLARAGALCLAAIDRLDMASQTDRRG